MCGYDGQFLVALRMIFFLSHLSSLHFWCAACPRANGMWQASCFCLLWHGGTYAKNALHETACLMMKKITQTLTVWVGECTQAIGRGCCRCWTGKCWFALGCRWRLWDKVPCHNGITCAKPRCPFQHSVYDFEYVVIAPPEAKCPWAPERRRHQ